MTTSILRGYAMAVTMVTWASTLAMACGGPTGAREPTNAALPSADALDLRAKGIAACRKQVYITTDCFSELPNITSDEPPFCAVLTQGRWEPFGPLKWGTSSSKNGPGHGPPEHCSSEDECDELRFDGSDWLNHGLAKVSLRGQVSKACYVEAAKMVQVGNNGAASADKRKRDDKAREDAKREEEEADAARKRKEAAEKAEREGEATAWASVNAPACAKPKTAKDCDSVDAYLRSYPNGPHAAEARKARAEGAKAIDALKAAEDERLAREAKAAKLAARKSCLSECGKQKNVCNADCNGLTDGLVICRQRCLNKSTDCESSCLDQ